MPKYLFRPLSPSELERTAMNPTERTAAADASGQSQIRTAPGERKAVVIASASRNQGIMDSGASNQIRQMANFILQEAHEKANEINIKTEHDFNLEKQMLVHSAKLKIQEEYTQKEKDREIQERM